MQDLKLIIQRPVSGGQHPFGLTTDVFNEAFTGSTTFARCEAAADARECRALQAALTKALHQVRSIMQLETEGERLRMAQQCVPGPVGLDLGALSRL